MNNNQQVGQQGGQQTNPQQNRNNQQRPVMDQQARNFNELLANNMALIPKGVTYEVTDKQINRSVELCLERLGVENVHQKVFCVTQYNTAFSQVLKGKQVNPKHPIDPFNVYIVLRLDKEDRKRMKGGKRGYGNGTGYNQVMNRLFHNKADKAQGNIMVNKKLNEALAQFTTREVKFQITPNGNAARFKLDCDIVMRYIFDIPENQGNFIVDILNVHDQRRKGFKAIIHKTFANKTFKQSDFDPSKCV